MTACTYRLDGDPNGLRCLLDDHPNHPNGHRYAGSAVPDGHDASEAAAEVTRG